MLNKLLRVFGWQLVRADRVVKTHTFRASGLYTPSPGMVTISYEGIGGGPGSGATK